MKEENESIIKAINMYGRVPEHWELLNEIERLNNIIKEVREYITTEQLYTDYQWGKSQYAKILKDLLEILDKEK